jgi:hypothetical protein
MRRSRIMIVVTTLALALAGTFAASPLLAVSDIRRAVQTGDTATLERRVDWASVRESLKRSAGTRQVFADWSEAAGIEKPGLWQRVRNAAAPWVADPLIERYVTAEGAPRLWAWRQTWKERIRPRLGLAEPSSALHGTWLAGTVLDRAWTVGQRVERVSLDRPTRVTLEIRDRLVENRRWRVALELRSLTWMLTDVEALRAPGPASG